MNTLSRGSVKVNAYYDKLFLPTCEPFGTPTDWREVPVKLHMNEHFLFLKIKLNLRRDVRRRTDNVHPTFYATTKTEMAVVDGIEVRAALRALPGDGTAELPELLKRM
jgi:hypothetical protein